MKAKLGKKQRVSNKDWLDVAQNIEQYISKEELDAVIERTIKEITEVTKDKNVAYAWSAGKDSLVLGKLCEMAGINNCVLVVTDLEYTAFMKWVEENKPKGLEIVNTGQDLEWLSKHIKMLFPNDSKIASQWFHMVQHRGQAKYYKAHDLDMILLGRRRADGNYVGKKSNIYSDSKGITRYSPLASWTHEDVLAFLLYYKVAIPPIYSWKNGYLCGTHPWAARQWTGSVENGWREVYEIEPDIVIKAAEKIQSARDFLSLIK